MVQSGRVSPSSTLYVCVMSWGVKEDKTQLNKYSPEQKNVKELNQGILKEIKDIR